MTKFDSKIDYVSAALTKSAVGDAIEGPIRPTQKTYYQEKSTLDYSRQDRRRITRPLLADDCSFFESAGADKPKDGIYQLNGLKNPDSGQVFSSDYGKAIDFKF